MIVSFEVACILCFHLYSLYYDHQDLFALLGQRLQSGTYLRCPTYMAPTRWVYVIYFLILNDESKILTFPIDYNMCSHDCILWSCLNNMFLSVFAILWPPRLICVAWAEVTKRDLFALPDLHGPHKMSLCHLFPNIEWWK